MSTEYVDIVDEQDKVTGQATRSTVRKKHLIHRGTAIFVFNPQDEIYVHKRSPDKDIYPGYYDIAFGGCVLSGESYLESAVRELEEEAGINNAKLKFLFKTRYKSRLDDLFISVYKCIYKGKLVLQPEEIESGCFMTVEAMQKLAQKEKICPDSLVIFDKYLEMGSGWNSGGNLKPACRRQELT